MSTSAPYWGALPAPKARRISQDGSLTPDRRQSLDASSHARGPSKQKRDSVQTIQTTDTDMMTDTTHSVLTSPNRLSFQGQGLAPRPPSLPYGANQYPADLQEKRQRRRSRNQEPDYPPSEGVPRATRASAMDGTFADRQKDLPVLDRTRNTLEPTPNVNGKARRNGTGPSAFRSTGMADSNRPHQRRGSVGEPTRRDSMGLGLGLGQPSGRRNFTKEEKRALAEAAERAARKREKSTTTTRESGSQPPAQPEAVRRRRVPENAPPVPAKEPISQQVRFSELVPPPALAVDVPKTSNTPRSEEVTPATPVAPVTPVTPVTKGPLAQHPPEDGQRFKEYAGVSPQAQAPDSRVSIPAVPRAKAQVPAQTSGMPQRNLSFRERAAKNQEMPLPGVDSEQPTTPLVTTPGGTMFRGGSNKLRKNPPAGYIQSSPRSNEARVRTAVPNGPGPAGVSIRPRQMEDTEPVSPAGEKPILLDQEAAPAQNTPAQLLNMNQGVGPQHAMMAAAGAGAAASQNRRVRRGDTRSDTDSSDDEHQHHVSDLVYGRAQKKLLPGQGSFKPTTYLDEWKKATVGTLSGGLLDLTEEVESAAVQAEKDKAWWETPPSKRRSSMPSRPRKAEAFDGEYDDTHAPTRFKPPLYLKCGPLLRFCGIRIERGPSRAARNEAPRERQMWRGSVMIVTRDADSSYDIAPTLRLFVQAIELLPPPPAEIHGELAPEHVDPIAGHPKLGRKGETLYVRPVDHLEEGKDVSRDETDDGLFEKTRSPPEMALPEGATDPPGSFAARRKRVELDGEKAGKYKDVRGFCLHAERGVTFWRFNIEVELQDEQQRIAYRINRGPSTGFWVPAKGAAMNIMFHSCNGFSLSVQSDEFSGPDPMWRDVLNTHQSSPFHVMIGGGDQIYNDAVMKQTDLFQEWLAIQNPVHKYRHPFPPEMQDELESFYLERYSMWFSQGLFGMANSQIPMVNMYDDHDIIDGFGSYPHHFMMSPVFAGLGNVAFKYYMLFQHQSVPAETGAAEPSWTLGLQPGPYIHELSRSLFMSLGGSVALLAVDARTERTRDNVISDGSWKKLMDRCYEEIVKGKVHHLLVLLGVPIAYPRLVWLENILTSRLLDPLKALSKAGMLGNFMNRFDGGVEILDDLDDHWTAKNHKDERATVIEDLQDLAADKSVRVTILSGDVHLAAVGQFYSNPKLGLAKHNDFRYMPNIISSAIVNTPPQDIMADILNKRNKVHHFDKETDEDMIPIFTQGVDSKPRNNKRMLPHRNWCSIRPYVPGQTPPATPLMSPTNRSPERPGGMVRRLSKPRRNPSYRGPDAVMDKSRPPISSGLFRSFSKRRASVDDVGRPSPSYGFPTPEGAPIRRTTSLSERVGNLFRRMSSSDSRPRRHDDGGINGTWGDDSDSYTEDEDITPPEPLSRQQQQYQYPGKMALRGGGSGGAGFLHEYMEGDDSYFTAKPLPPAPTRRATITSPPQKQQPTQNQGLPSTEFQPKPMHRTPTTLSTKQKKYIDQLAVNLEGGLEVCLNVEVSQRDPTGITVPYRLLVPRLWYEEDKEEGGQRQGGYEGFDGDFRIKTADGNASGEKGGIKRFFSLERGKGQWEYS